MGQADVLAATIMQFARAPRKQVDPSGGNVRYLKDRIFRPEAHTSPAPVLCAAGAGSQDLVPPAACLANASTSICSRFVYSTFNRERCAVNVVVWTPDGRRLVAGGNNGMLTLYSGVNFIYETAQQAHEAAMRCLVYSHSGEWLISADHEGIIKYWTTTLNPVKDLPDAHAGSPVRDLSFSPTDAKFVSCADDATIKVWDFERGTLERVLGASTPEAAGKSHGWDVKAAQWHPSKGMIASGSKDNVVKLWDPRVRDEICELHLHKNTVTCLKWHSSGNFFATGSRDQLIKLFDVRTMREVAAFKGHKREVGAITYIHAYIYTCIQAGGGGDREAPAYVHACMHACTHTYMHTYMHTCIHS